MGPELIVLLAAITACWLAGFAVLWRAPYCRDDRTPPPSGDVAIIIPARNEEANLPKLLGSIARQPVGPAQLLVVDDGSTDRTGEVTRAGGARVLQALPPAEGWRGKTSACAQGAIATTADHLLFLDADTWIEPRGLDRMRSAYADAQKKGGHATAISVCPYHVVPRWFEQFSAVFNLVMVAGIGAFAARPGRLTGAFGQMLLISREQYDRAGGHAAVKDRALETVWIGRRLAESGTPVRCLLGRGALSMRMYPDGLRDLIAGWAKGFAAGAGTTAPVHLLLIIAWLSGGMMASTLFTRAPLPIALVAYVAYVVQHRLFLRRLGSYWLATSVFYPLPLLFFFGVFSLSLLRPKRSVQWKGRPFDAH